MLMNFRVVLVATLSLFTAHTARAGMLESASWLQAVELQGYPSVPMSRTTAQLGATGTSTTTSIAVSLSYPQTSIQFFAPKTQFGVLDVALTITQGGAQAITATPSMALADQGVMGTVLVMTANHVGMGLDQSMYAIGINTLLQIPLSVGVDGRFTDTFFVLGASHFITVDFYAWTPRTKTLTLPGYGTGMYSTANVVAMGSFDLDAAGNGMVTLVSPTRVHIAGPLAQLDMVSITTLKLTFTAQVPEPGTLLLIGAGALALGLTWRRSGSPR